MFIERCSVSNVRNIQKARRAVKKALENQLNGRGFSFVEFLSMCPTNWGLSAPAAAKWVEEEMSSYFPLGNFRDR